MPKYAKEMQNEHKELVRQIHMTNPKAGVITLVKLIEEASGIKFDKDYILKLRNKVSRERMEFLKRSNIPFLIEKTLELHDQLQNRASRLLNSDNEAAQAAGLKLVWSMWCELRDLLITHQSSIEKKTDDQKSIFQVEDVKELEMVRDALNYRLADLRSRQGLDSIENKDKI